MANTKVQSEQIADDAVVTSHIADNVGLGGSPTTTTQSPSDNSTKIATTAYVDAAYAALVDSSPATLNTLNELAAALGDDANFSTTITNSIATKVALSGSDQTIADSGNFTLDAAGDIILDADGGDIIFKDGGTSVGAFDLTGGFAIKSTASNADFFIQGNDGGSAINAVQFDMSNAGAATFNSHITINNTGADRKFAINRTGGKTFSIEHDTSGFYIYNVTDSSVHTRFTNTGNLGIGENSPLGKLHIKEDDSGVSSVNSNFDQLVLEDDLHSGMTILSGTSGDGAIYFGDSGSNDIGQIKYKHSSNQLDLTTSGQTRLTINSSGSVGIGETNPAAPLHVEHSSATAYNGAAEITESLIVSNKNGTDDSGVNNVASIGLHVADGATSQGFINYVRTGNNTGKFTFSHRKASTTYTEDFVITDAGTYGMGQGSGNLAGSIIINNDGGTGSINNAYYNTVLGWEAADDLTSGDSNTIVGNQAGYKLTEATGCTLIGRLAGEKLTTGSYNTAIGFNTMGDGVVTGSSNTAVGNSVLVAVTSGAGNTALGEACASTISTGSNNVAIGRSVMSVSTVTANYNVGIGYEALRRVTSGGENVCVGREAGRKITSGVQNVSIGHESLMENQTGQGSVAVGFQALENTTGGENIAMGWKAGEANEGGVYNVFLGSMTRGTHPSHSQQIAIGRNIDAAPGQVAIGTSGLGKVYNEFDTDNAWSQGSDERLKQDIKDSTLGLDFINDLRPVTYRWKPSNELPETFPMYDEENQRNTDIVMTGLIAQEVKTAIETSGVERFGGWGEDNDGIQQIKKELFVFPLINAVKELTAKLEAAEARIKVLEG